MELISFMAAPFVASILLAGLLGYFGQHVLRREILFIDIALAQIAALGVTVAFLLKIDPHSQTAYLFSLLFTLIAAAFYASSRRRFTNLSQEAVIGITYVLAAALALLLTDKAAGAAEHLKEMLVGSLLWVRWNEIAVLSAIALIVGAVHLLFRRHFTTLSDNHDGADNLALHWRWWDFLFYATFGLVITQAVAVAGVIVVFSFLIMPATIAAMFAQGWSGRLYIAWAVGTLASVLGLGFSYHFDFSSGPSVVCWLGVVLIVAAIVRRLGAKKR